MSSIRHDRVFVIGGALLVAASLLSAQRGEAPDPLVQENATTKVGPHTWVIPDDNVPLVPNVGIVVGTDATLVIDPGLGRRNGDRVLREVAKVSSTRQLFVASTHFHPEHTTGYLAFPPTARYVNSVVQETEWDENGMQMVQAFSKRSPLTMELLKGATRRTADITYERDYTLDLGGVTVRMLVVGPTHTRGDTGFFVEQDRVLFAGDVVMNESFLAASGVTSMKAWLSAFDAFEAWEPTTVVPAHGATGDVGLIADNRAIMLDIQSRARELKAEGRSIEEVAKVVSSELTAKHPDRPRVNGIAAAARAAFNEAE